MKKRSILRPEIQAILNKREAQGLRFAIWTCIGLLLLNVLSLPGIASGLREIILSYAVFSVLIITCIVTIGCILVVFAHLLLALNDPRSVFTSDYKEATFGPAASINFFVSNIIQIMVVGILCILMTHRSRRTVIEAVDLQNANSQLSRYFSPNIVKKISSEQSSFFKPGGRVHDVAVLFSDIRSFTTLSESLQPDEVLRMLSDYQQRMTDAIFKYGGTLDKFIGDGIMATFGTPDQSPDDAERAVLAGLEMNRALIRMNDERSRQNLAPIRHGIGIHFGPALVGNVGTSQRLEFTVIGDTVNAASRIESACKETKRDFLISGTVKERLGVGIATEDLGPIGVKGKNIPLNVFAVLGG